MRTILRSTIFNAISLFILFQLLPGVKITGGLSTLLLSGFILTVLFRILKPVLGLFSLPLNVITLGLFSFFINTILLYILTVFVPSITVSAFTFNGYNFTGFVVPVMHFNGFWAYVIAAGLLSIIINFFDWLIKR